MKIAEYKQIDTEYKKITIHHDEKPIMKGDATVGFEPAWDEEVTEEIPIMGVVYREMTAEEIAEMEAIPKPNILPTDTERIEAIEEAVMELAEMLMGGEVNG